MKIKNHQRITKEGMGQQCVPLNELERAANFNMSKKLTDLINESFPVQRKEVTDDFWGKHIELKQIIHVYSDEWMENMIENLKHYSKMFEGNYHVNCMIKEIYKELNK